MCLEQGKEERQKSSEAFRCQVSIKRKLSSIDVIDFDPRAKSHRHVKTSHINTLLKDLQTVSQISKDISMWETQLEMNYEDYELGDVDISQLLGRAL